jgi:hypothetical protein
MTKKLKQLIEKKGEVHDALDDLSFGQLIVQVHELQAHDKSAIFNDLKITKNNLAAIVKLRNVVSHNRFLLDNRNLKKCYIDGIVSTSLRANCQNLCSHLPKQLRETFITEIKTSSLPPDNTDNERSKQVEWGLINDIIIEL